MPYTEIKIRNGNNYYYRVISVRQGRKVGKKRFYLGKNLPERNLAEKEKEIGKEFLKIKRDKTLLKIKPKITKVLKKYGVKKAGIFGSYARGEQTKDSDIDIIISPPKGIGFGFAGIAIKLEEALKKKVDLITYNGIYHLLRKKILDEEVRII
jgi:uncharacterized protein